MSRWKDTLDALMRERAAALFGYAYVLTGNADGVARLRPLVSTIDFPTDNPVTVHVHTTGGTR